MSLKERFEELPEDIESSDVTELRRALVRTQKQLKDAKNRTEELVEVTIQATKDATPPANNIGMAPDLSKNPKLFSQPSFPVFSDKYLSPLITLKGSSA